MLKRASDPEREERIDMQIVVDTYNAEETAMGWYCYLEGVMQFPFPAICTAKRRISPLKDAEAVTVVGMAPEDECMAEMFVEVEWDGDILAVPLVQLDAPEADAKTREAIGDWHYWVDRGYSFG